MSHDHRRKMPFGVVDLILAIPSCVGWSAGSAPGRLPRPPCRPYIGTGSPQGES